MKSTNDNHIRLDLDAKIEQFCGWGNNAGQTLQWNLEIVLFDTSISFGKILL